VTDCQQLHIAAGGMDPPETPWIWAPSAVGGRRSCQLAVTAQERVCTCAWVPRLGPVLPVWGPACCVSVGTAPGAALPGPAPWPRGAGAGGGNGVCQGTVAAVPCQDAAKAQGSPGVWPHLDGELHGSQKACVLCVLAFEQNVGWYLTKRQVTVLTRVFPCRMRLFGPGF